MDNLAKDEINKRMVWIGSRGKIQHRLEELNKNSFGVQHSMYCISDQLDKLEKSDDLGPIFYIVESKGEFLKQFDSHEINLEINRQWVYIDNDPELTKFRQKL